MTTPASIKEKGTKVFLDNLLLSHAFTTFTTELYTKFALCNWLKTYHFESTSYIEILALVTQGDIGPFKVTQ